MRYTNDKGFTLIELLVAIAIAAIVMIAIISAYQIQVRGKNTQEALTDMNQTARAAMEIMTHELRTAGCDPNRNAGAGIVNATVNDLTFTMDIGNTAGDSFRPDSLLDGPSESIRYALNGLNLGRDTGGGAGLQPLALNVDALNFVYLDGFNPPNVIAPDAAGVIDAGDLDDIRSIQVSIVARAGQFAGGFMYAHTDTTPYVNPQGDVILAAQNDGFRRLQLTTTVNCRNLGTN